MWRRNLPGSASRPKEKVLFESVLSHAITRNSSHTVWYSRYRIPAKFDQAWIPYAPWSTRAKTTGLNYETSWPGQVFFLIQVKGLIKIVTIFLPYPYSVSWIFPLRKIPVLPSSSTSRNILLVSFCPIIHLDSYLKRQSVNVAIPHYRNPYS